MKKKSRLFNLLPNTVTKNMYSITPSHNIQQKTDMKKYCNNAATNLQAYYYDMNNMQIYFISIISHASWLLAFSIPAMNTMRPRASAMHKFK